MGNNEKKQRLLERAAALYGRKALADGLKVNEQLLNSWMDGKAPMPDRMLMPLADLVVSLAGKDKK